VSGQIYPGSGPKKRKRKKEAGMGRHKWGEQIQQEHPMDGMIGCRRDGCVMNRSLMLLGVTQKSGKIERPQSMTTK